MIEARLWIRDPYGKVTLYEKVAMPLPRPEWHVAVRQPTTVNWNSNGDGYIPATNPITVVVFRRAKHASPDGSYDYVYTWGT